MTDSFSSAEIGELIKLQSTHMACAAKILELILSRETKINNGRVLPASKTTADKILGRNFLHTHFVLTATGGVHRFLFTKYSALLIIDLMLDTFRPVNTRRHIKDLHKVYFSEIANQIFGGTYKRLGEYYQKNIDVSPPETMSASYTNDTAEDICLSFDFHIKDYQTQSLLYILPLKDARYWLSLAEEKLYPDPDTLFSRQ